MGKLIDAVVNEIGDEWHERGRIPTAMAVKVAAQRVLEEMFEERQLPWLPFESMREGPVMVLCPRPKPEPTLAEAAKAVLDWWDRGTLDNHGARLHNFLRAALKREENK